MIQVKNLSKIYTKGFIPRKTEALKDINFEIDRGEIFGYLGPNGAGKTTTIKILLNLIFPSGGKAFIRGIDVTGVESRKRVGFMPDHPYFYDYLTAGEFLDYCGKLFLYDRKKRKELIDDLLELVGILKHKDLQIRKFSRGMMQRLGIAQALINDPEILILDEPLSGLDPVGRRELKDIIRHQKEKGKTIFFSSHILADAEDLCDRIGILVEGSLKYIGEIGEIANRNVEFYEITACINGFESYEPLKSDFAVQNLGDNIIKVKVKEEKIVSGIAKKILNNGGTIMSIVPKRKSLEDIFIEETIGKNKKKIGVSD